MSKESQRSISRRKFLKYGGLAGGALSLAGIAGELPR